MGSTRSRASTPWWAMTNNSTEEFLMTSSGEGRFGLPSPKRRNVAAQLALAAATLWMENALATQATTTVPPWTVAHGWKPTSSSSNATLIMEGSRQKPVLSIPPPSRRQCHDKASLLTSRLLPWSNHTHRHGMSPCLRWRGS
jgi:hypothetical protein